MEAQALRHLTDFPLSGQTSTTSAANGHHFTVRTPKLLHWNESTTTQIHEHMPHSTTLKSFALEHYAVPTSPTHEPECRQLGQALGRWLNAFNRRTGPASQEQAALRRTAAENRDAQGIRHHFSYGWLPDRIKEYPDILGEDREGLEQVLAMANEEMKDEETLQVVHGDLAPAKYVSPFISSHQCCIAPHTQRH